MKNFSNGAKMKIASALGALGTLALAAATHAQVTFSATAPQAALTNSIDGSLDFFWDNATGVLDAIKEDPAPSGFEPPVRISKIRSPDGDPDPFLSVRSTREIEAEEVGA